MENVMSASKLRGASTQNSSITKSNANSKESVATTSKGCNPQNEIKKLGLEPVWLSAHDYNYNIK